MGRPGGGLGDVAGDPLAGMGDVGEAAEIEVALGLMYPTCCPTPTSRSLGAWMRCWLKDSCPYAEPIRGFPVSSKIPDLYATSQHVVDRFSGQSGAQSLPRPMWTGLCRILDMGFRESLFHATQ